MFKNTLTIVLAITFFLSGCIPVPIGYRHPEDLVDKSTLDTFIGMDKEDILTALGRPNDVLVSDEQSYFIYGGHGTEAMLMLLVYVPMFPYGDPEGKLFCVLLEFDKDNIFQRYSINRHSKIWTDNDSVSDCASTYFSKEELKSFSRGDTWNFRARLVKEIGIYCPNADLGHPNAQYHIGRLYHAGDLLKQDLVQSYVWYSLAANNGYELAAIELNKIKSELSAEEITEANMLLSTWQTGKCRENLLGAALQGSE